MTGLPKFAVTLKYNNLDICLISDTRKLRFFKCG